MSNTVDGSSSVSFLPFLIVLILACLIFIGLCVLEFFLARKVDKKYGLFLPIASFGIATLISLSMFLLMPGDLRTVIPGIIYTGALANIPTVILLLIFFVARSLEKDVPKKNKEIEKMNILDLE